MKIIDLLNKIANGEKIPKKIKYHGTIYEKFDYNNKYYDIERDNKEIDILSEHLASEGFYNDEVEIIEEDKKIEKIKVLNSDDENDISSLGVTLDLKTLKNKTNEIIDYLMENKQ